jgi:hypothetical protein
VNENSELQKKLDELKVLNRNRFDYVLVRSRVRSITAALEEIGLSWKWWVGFSEEERAHLEALADDLHKEKRIQAEMILLQAIPDAADVLVSGLKSRNENIKQNAANDILDRVMGKPTQKQEVTGANGGPVTLKVVYDDKPTG